MTHDNIEPKNSSREALAQAFDRDFVKYRFQRVDDAYEYGWQAATAACDAHWRERLQSDEMVKMTENIIAHRNATFLTARELLAAISKEMGV